MNKKAPKTSHIYFPLEFQISREQWDYYEFGRDIIPPEGEITVPDFQILRKIVMRIYGKKDLTTFSLSPLRAGHLNAIGLINEILRCVIRRYCEIKNPASFTEGLSRAKETVTAQALEKTIGQFAEFFPPFSALRGKAFPREFLEGETAGIPNRHIVAAELILLNLANRNPAFSPAQELFRDAELSRNDDYASLLRALDAFFKTQAGFGRENKPLVDFLREPIISGGDSLVAQLTYIKDRWREYITENLFLRLLTAIDILREEEKIGLLEKGPALVPRFTGEEYTLGPE